MTLPDLIAHLERRIRLAGAPPSGKRYIQLFEGEWQIVCTALRNHEAALAALRERCAKVAREYPDTELGRSHSNQSVCFNTAQFIAAALRALPLEQKESEHG